MDQALLWSWYTNGLAPDSNPSLLDWVVQGCAGNSPGNIAELAGRHEKYLKALRSTSAVFGHQP